MVMPGRKYPNTSSYRYGFNGKENDNEVKGEGNQQDYGMRIYDVRIGRFLSVDPLTKEYPMLNPYQFASNRPIDGIDLDGLEWTKAFKAIWNGFKGSYSVTKESLSATSLKKTGNDIVGTVKDAGNMAMGKKGAAESFSKRVTNFSVGVSNSVTEPAIFFSTMQKRSLKENLYGIGFYIFQIGLTALPEVWAEANSVKAGMAASYEGNQLIRNALRDGVEIRIAKEGTEELMMMNKRGAAATYGTDLNHPAGVVTLREGFGRADILEEAIHVEQRKLYGEEFFNSNVLSLEIQAQDRLLEIGKKENWTKTEMDKIRDSKKKYEELQKKKR